MAWKRSFAEDNVDRFNHTWAVLFLLLLSFVTWLLPLGQVQQTGPREAATSSSKSKTGQRYVATCWCPAEFTGSSVAYTNMICGNAYTKMMNDPDFNSSTANVRFYAFDDPLLVDERSDYKPPRQQESESPFSDKKPKDKKYLGFMKQYFTHFVIPLTLFVLAIGLKLPHILWLTVASCNSLNIHQAIQAAKDEQNLGQAGQQKSEKGDKSVLSSALKPASSRTALLYLAFKALVCIVVIVELSYVYTSVLPLSKSLSGRSSRPSMKPNPAATPAKQNNNDDLLLCDFEIRMLQNIRHFVVQCAFTEINAPDADVKPRQGLPPMKSSSIIGIYQSLIVVLVVFLLVLAIVDVANLIGWILKLTVWRGRPLQRSNDSMDVSLLIYMAIDNAGYLVARSVEASIPTSSTSKSDDNELEPLKATA